MVKCIWIIQQQQTKQNQITKVYTDEAYLMEQWKWNDTITISTILYVLIHLLQDKYEYS